MSPPSVADLALLGDGHGSALVDRRGSVEWWCARRFDAPSTFARLLGPDAGHWSITPVASFTVERAYVEGTLVLRSEFRTDGGAVALLDALALAPGAEGHEVGRDAPHELVRVLEGVEGEVELELELAPRPEYGLVTPEWERADGALRTLGGSHGVVLAADADLDVAGGTVRGHVTVREGERVGFTLRHRAGMGLAPGRPEAAAPALADTVRGWRSWSGAHQDYDGPYRDEVRRSALVLHALTYGPSGAVVAAPTTSLPERVGGAANWDYRYAWLRDASLTLQALWIGACPEEAARYVRWMAHAAVGSAGEPVQIMFGVEGERDLTEHELGHLPGFRESRPVRVGNDAWHQRQLDVHGEVLDAAWRFRDRLGALDEPTQRFLCSLADRALAAWREPDAGIWEGREGERHYLSSKLMSWVALDRGVLLADRLGPGARPEAWERGRDEVREAVLRDGFHEGAGAFTGAFGSEHLDASALLVPLVGFLPGDDPRVRSTVAAIEAELGDGALVRRWSGTEEGGFVIASFWLAEAHALAGETGRAREIIDAVLGWGNDVGLLSEVIDPGAGGLIGNFPQAFSHVGLITAAWAVGEAEERAR